MAGTVTVACSLPHGFMMQPQQKVSIPAPSQTDSNRREDTYVRAGTPIKINGPAPNRDPRRIMSGGTVPSAGAYALTFGVDKDAWDKFVVEMKDWDPLRKGHVFAAEREDAARGKAKEDRAGPTGLEPFNPSKPPAEFAGKIKTADTKGA